MAVSTYNYVGINSPSGTHKASSQTNASRVAPSDGGWGELPSADYDKIESSNDVRFTVEAENAYALLLCRFVATEAVADMTQIKGLAEGWGHWTTGEVEDWDFFLYIYNFDTPAWELLGSHTGSSDATVSGTKSADLENYVDENGYIYLLVSSGTDVEAEAHTDYVELEITYTTIGLPEIAQGILKPFRGARLKRTHPLARGQVLHLLMNEGCGDKVYDLTGNGNTGTLTNMDPATDWVAGRRGWALDFDGSNDYIVIPHNKDFVNPTGTSFSVYFKLNQLPSVAGETKFLMEKTHGSSPWRSWALMIYHTDGWQDKILLLGVSTGGATSTSVSNAAVIINKWYHLMGVINGAEQKLYVDGKLNDTDALDGLSASTGVLYVGSSWGAANFNGLIDQPIIFNRGLTAGEVWRLYDDSYQMIYQPRPPLFFITSIPVMMHHYRGLREA